jgi:hypothetical protein
MISIDEMEGMLNEIAESFPPALYKELNGGIILLPDRKENEQSVDHDLFILGEYHNSLELGRYIAIYYGSFAAVFGGLARAELRQELKETLKHEFRHHVESLAGERDQEIEDEIEMARYLNTKAGRKRKVRRFSDL